MRRVVYCRVAPASDAAVPPQTEEALLSDGLLETISRAPGKPPAQRICIWESDGDAGDITCEIVGAPEASALYGAASPLGMAGERRRPGEAISAGHRSYELMLNLQLGISFSVGRLSGKPAVDVVPGDFSPRSKFRVRFPLEGSRIRLPHSSREFRWEDYCPSVFRSLRTLFEVDSAEYMMAICGDGALREFSSPGKSGSFFYLTQDNRFIIKTVKKSELKVLIRMLPHYYRHVSRYSDTMLTKFYGAHSVKPPCVQKVRFIVMGNVFCSEYHMHQRFDLKGSWHGRTAGKLEVDETTTLKDLDLNLVFRMTCSWCFKLYEQLKRDCDFLVSMGIMDYSFLLGVHFCDGATSSSMRGSSEDVNSPQLCFSHHDSQHFSRASIRLGSDMPAKAENISGRSHIASFVNNEGLLVASRRFEVFHVILSFGIIDILQDYDIIKKLEHAYKSLQADPISISAVDPKLYAERFEEFICRIFVAE